MKTPRQIEAAIEDATRQLDGLLHQEHEPDIEHGIKMGATHTLYPIALNLLGTQHPARLRIEQLLIHGKQSGNATAVNEKIQS